MKTLRDSSEKHEFQAEVDRMMKLIINSLYKNKEVRLYYIVLRDGKMYELASGSYRYMCRLAIAHREWLNFS